MSQSNANTYLPATTTISQFGGSVYGVQINGFIFSTPTTSTTASTTNASETSTTPTISSAINQQSSTSSSAGLTTGAKIGIGVGVSLSVLGLCALVLAFFLVRRSKSKVWQMDGSPVESTTLPEQNGKEPILRKPVASQRISTRASVAQTVSPKPSSTPWEDTLVGPDTSHEVGLAQQDSVHEMSATLKVPFESSERPLSRQD